MNFVSYNNKRIDGVGLVLRKADGELITKHMYSTILAFYGELVYARLDNGKEIKVTQESFIRCVEKAGK